MAAYSFRRSGTPVASSSSAAISPSPGTHNTNYFTGDLLLLATLSRTAALTCASITGWTQIYAQNTNKSIEVWARIADGGANDTPSVDWPGTSRAVAWIDSFYGDVQTTLASLLHASNVQTGSSTGPPPTPVLSNASNGFTLNDCLLYAFAAKNSTAVGDTTALLAPSGMTLAGSYINNSASGILVGTAYVQQTAQTDWGGTDFSMVDTTPEDVGYAGIILALTTLAASDSPLILPHRSSGGMIDLSGNFRG